MTRDEEMMNIAEELRSKVEAAVERAKLADERGKNLVSTLDARLAKLEIELAAYTAKCSELETEIAASTAKCGGLESENLGLQRHLDLLLSAVEQDRFDEIFDRASRRVGDIASALQQGRAQAAPNPNGLEAAPSEDHRSNTDPETPSDPEAPSGLEAPSGPEAPTDPKAATGPEAPSGPEEGSDRQSEIDRAAERNPDAAPAKAKSRGKSKREANRSNLKLISSNPEEPAPESDDVKDGDRDRDGDDDVAVMEVVERLSSLSHELADSESSA